MQMYESVVPFDNFYLYSSLVVVATVWLNLTYIKKCGNGKCLSVKQLICTSLLTPAMPIVILGFCVFSFIRAFLGVILRIMYGNRFMGFFSNIDAMHGRSILGKSTINVLLMGEYENGLINEDEIFESVKDTIASVVLSNNKKTVKLFCTLRHCFGYRFLLKKTNIDSNDCVKKMKVNSDTDVITKPELMDLLMYYTKQPFPFDNEFLWDVHVGTQPVLWKTVVSKKYYPILFRFHHCVADGVNIFNFITGVCGYSEQKGNTAPLKRNTNILFIILQFVLKTILCFILYPAILYTTLVMRNENLHLNIQNTHKKGGSVVLEVEEIQTYLKKIYNICKNCNVSFTGVLAAAFSASISEYYKSRYDSAPSYLTTMIPFHLDSLALKILDPGSKQLDDINFSNEYEISFVQLPVQPDDIPYYNSISMIDRLSLVMESLNQENRRSNFRMIVNHAIKTYFTICPSSVLKLTTYFTEYGPVISNLPGTPKMCFGKDCIPISDYIIFVPDMKRFSFILSTTTYDNRLHLAIGTSMDIKFKELQKMLRNIYKHIDILEKEVESLSSISVDSLSTTF